ncbi:MAG: hypothetical protein WCD21_03255 [Streptomyces sp.]
MLIQPAGDPTAQGSAVRAGAFAAFSSALAVGLHHVTAESPVAGLAVLVAAIALFLCAFGAFARCSARTAAIVLASAQSVLPSWLNATERYAAPDEHHRLPPTWHHSGIAMALLNLATALVLAWLLHGACAVPAQLVNACLRPARQWLRRVALALGSLHLASYQAVVTGPHRRSTDHPPLSTAFLALRHLRVPCGP